MRECIKCHQLKDDSEFYEVFKWHQINTTKIYSKKCKDCICKDININDYNTYIKGTFGRYNSLMKLCSFSTFHYKDNQYIKELQELKEKNLKILDKN